MMKRPTVFACVMLTLCMAPSLWAQGIPGAGSLTVYISEFMASNDATLLDEDGESSDWIEITNGQDAAADLGGYYLTDDAADLKKWKLPAMSLAAGARLVVFASGKDRSDPAGGLHTDFQLASAAGGYLALTDGAQAVSVFADYPGQKRDVSFGLTSVVNLVSIGFFLEPNPGEANSGATTSGFVADTTFSVDRGFYEEPFALEITSATPGASIIYTTDGSPPSEGNGEKVDAADATSVPKATTQIETTATIRAIGVKDGFEPTNVDSHSYIFASDVLQQSGDGFGGRRWGHAGSDWEMDPAVVNHDDPESRVVPEDMKRIPTVSVTLPFDEMWGTRGIYISGEGVEKACGIEYFNEHGNVADPNAGGDFQVDGTIQVVGGSSTGRWKSDNLSLRLKFDSDLQFELFDGGAARRFDTLVLDARLNHAWHYGGGSDPVNQRGRALYFRDQMAADIQREMGGYAPRGKHVHVYISGIYWGIRMLHERPDDNFAASYMGGDNSEYAAMKHRTSTEVAPNSRTPYSDFLKLVRKDMTDPINYAAVTAVFDPEHHVGYMLTNFYIGNTDWAHQNWYASYGRDRPDGKWRYHSWDAEHTFKSRTENVISKNDSGGPTEVHTRLMKSQDYALLFADKVNEHFRNGGLFTPERIIALFHKRLDPVDLAIRAQSARWGDNQRSRPYTRGDEYLEEKERLLTDYFPRRGETVLGQIERKSGWYPDTEAPVFGQHGGEVASGFALTMTSESAGTVFYTMDGSDPRQPGTPPEDVVVIDTMFPKKGFVPTEDIGTDWRTKTTAEGFDDSGWSSGLGAIGLDNGTDYHEFIDPGLDFFDEMRGKNATVYVRAEFDLEAAAGPADLLQLEMRYDDGFVAYINGHEVARANADGEPVWNSSATQGHDDDEAIQFLPFPLAGATQHLRVGTNVLAIHGLNSSAGGSDMLCHPRLVMTQAGGGGGVLAETAVAYTEPVSLDGSARVMARTLGTGGEWSALTKASFFVGTVPADSSNLVVSELSYRPAAASAAEIDAGFEDRRDFEFLELKNIGAAPVDLRGVEFTAGIGFRFEESAIQELAPDEHVLIVDNTAAMELRYGAGLPIAGEFDPGTQLGNGGEAITIVNTRLADGQQGVRTFVYDDAAPWPTKPDGEGFTLVLSSPEMNPDHDAGSNWVASVAIGGTPGRSEGDAPAGGFAKWLADNGLNGAAPGDDSDGDGQANVVEYFFGTLPTDGSEVGGVTIARTGDGTVELLFQRPSDRTDAVFTVQKSVGLADWIDVPNVDVEVADEPVETVRVTVPGLAAPEEEYLRLVVTLK